MDRTKSPPGILKDKNEVFSRVPGHSDHGTCITCW